MIQLLFEGICKDCDSADLVIDSYETGLGEKYHTVRCIHNDACERMEDRTIERMLKLEETEKSNREYTF